MTTDATEAMTPPPAGHNRPPEPTPGDKIIDRAREYVAAGNAWLNEVQSIGSKEQADAAAAYVRQGSAIERDGDAQRKADKAPHVAAAKAVDDAWKDVLIPVGTAKTAVQAKLTAWLREEDRKQREQAEAARKAAEQAEAEAARAADRAFEQIDKAQRGELIGTGANTLSAVEEARQAQEAAEAAKEEADRLASTKAGAGGQYSVNGVRRTVTLRTRRRLEIDLPPNCPPRVEAIAAGKIAAWIATSGEKGHRKMLRDELVRIANAVYRATGDVAPHMTVIEEQVAQ